MLLNVPGLVKMGQHSLIICALWRTENKTGFGGTNFTEQWNILLKFIACLLKRYVLQSSTNFPFDNSQHYWRILDWSFIFNMPYRWGFWGWVGVVSCTTITPEYIAGTNWKLVYRNKSKAKPICRGLVHSCQKIYILCCLKSRLIPMVTARGYHSRHWCSVTQSSVDKCGMESDRSHYSLPLE